MKQLLPVQAVLLRARCVMLVGLLLVSLSGSSASRLMAQSPPAPAQTEPNAQVVQMLLGGYTALQNDDPATALVTFKQALSLARQLGDRPGEVASLNALGVTYLTQGLGLLGQNDLQGALAQDNDAVAAFRQAGSRQDEGHALEAIGTVHEFRYDFAQAVDFYQQALAIARETGDRSGETLAIEDLGDVARDQGHYGQALDWYQQALAIARERAAAAQSSDREQAARVDEARILAGIAGVYEHQSRFPEALALLQQQLATVRSRLSQASDAGDALRVRFYTVQQLGVINALGIVYNDLGQPAQALELHQQALTLARQRDDKDLQATVLSNVATDYDNLGQPGQAIVYYEQALEQVRASQDRFREQILLSNIGVAYADRKEFEPALAYGQQALPIARSVSDRPGEATALNLIGSASAGLGQYDRAIVAFQQALTIARELGDRRYEGVILGHLGEAYEQAGDLDRALEFDKQALAAEEDLRASARLEELKSSLTAQAAQLYAQTTLLLLRLGRADEAFAVTERGRARSLLDQLGNAPLNLSRRANPQLLQQEQELSAEISALDVSLRRERAKAAAERNPEAIQTLATQLTAKQQQYADLLTQVRLSDPESAALVSIAPLELADIQDRLEPGTALLAYFVTENKTLAFLVTHDSFQEIDLPVTAGELQASITDFRTFAQRGDPAPQSLQQLYGQLIAPLREQLSVPIVGVIPHGLLHYVPFAALTDGQRLFGEEHVLFELPSASSLPFIQQKRKSQVDTALVLGQSRAESLPPLRNAEREAQAIARLYGTTPLIGAAASETAFKAQAGQFDILHIAAHGELNPVSPLFSRIFLEPDAENDGSLTVQDVYSLDLAQADLVVLSACETQLGRQSKGDDIVGLTRAFIYAGSPSVIASLWTVDDEATSVLMTFFYRHLRAGMTKAQALQAAQADTRARYPDPYYWAAFVLSGDPGMGGMGSVNGR